MRYLTAILLFAFCFACAIAQDGYFVTFSNKNGTPYSITKPGEFLSQRAIERRSKQNISISQQDLPVNPSYTDSLKRAGIDVRHTTKWLNGAIVFSGNSVLMDTLDRISFVASVEKTKPAITTKASSKKFEATYNTLKISPEPAYGLAWSQISTVNGHQLHDIEYTGEGMHIAVIDAGFYKVNELPAFQHLWDNELILGTKDFVYPSSNIFAEHSHGMNVLSIIGGKIDNEYIGTAPDASFWLLRTEDAASEYPIEPDYWICAAEFADSAGVDIINTSLGYYEFDEATLSYTYDDLNASTRISRASDIASSKGMLIVTSAGNEGNSNWYYIGTPADAKKCLAIGAMHADSTKAGFSSFGPTADGRIKPDISAMGVSVALQSTNGSISKGNGTSFSAPVVSGLAACLWQALPGKSANEIRQLIIESANNYNQPDNQLGYGIPDFDLAYHVDIPDKKAGKKWTVSPNPFNNYLKIRGNSFEAVTVSVVDLTGKLKYRKTHYIQGDMHISEVANLPQGIYIVTLENKHFKQHVKVIKSY